MLTMAASLTNRNSKKIIDLTGDSDDSELQIQNAPLNSPRASRGAWRPPPRHDLHNGQDGLLGTNRPAGTDRSATQTLPVDLTGPPASKRRRTENQSPPTHPVDRPLPVISPQSAQSPPIGSSVPMAPRGPVLQHTHTIAQSAPPAVAFAAPVNTIPFQAPPPPPPTRFYAPPPPPPPPAAAVQPPGNQQIGPSHPPYVSLAALLRAEHHPAQNQTLQSPRYNTSRSPPTQPLPEASARSPNHSVYSHPPSSRSPPTHPASNQPPPTHPTSNQSPPTQSPTNQSPSTQPPQTQSPSNQPPTTQHPTNRFPSQPTPNRSPLNQSPNPPPSSQHLTNRPRTNQPSISQQVQGAGHEAQKLAQLLPKPPMRELATSSRDLPGNGEIARTTPDRQESDVPKRLSSAPRTSQRPSVAAQSPPHDANSADVNGVSISEASPAPNIPSRNSTPATFQYPPETPDPSSFTRYRKNAMQVMNNLINLLTEERTKALVDAVSRKRDPETMHWTPEEHALLIHAKEELQLRWADIHPRFFSFRGRDWHVCQTQYSQYLAIRARTKPAEGRTTFGRSQPRLSLRITDSGNVSSAAEPISDGASPDQSDSDEALTARNVRQKEAKLDQSSQLKAFSNYCPIPSSPQQTSGSYAHRLKQLNEVSRNAAALASGVSKLVSPVRPTFEMSARTFHSPLPSSQKAKTHKSICVQRPYLDFKQRQALNASIENRLWQDDAIEWQDQVLHVNFMDFEIRRLAPVVLEVMGRDGETQEPIDHFLSDILRDADEGKLCKIVRHAQNHAGIFNRTSDSLIAFLRDLASGQTDAKATSWQLGFSQPQRPHQASLSRSSMSSSLRSREMGLNHGRRASSIRVSPDLRATMEETLGPHLKFTGTSGDVNTVAWAPNGVNFAVGSAALTDSHSMQYNARNNLLFGTIDGSVLTELPHHATHREKTESGVNATHSMYVSQDPLLYQSVSAVQFTADGDALISTGFDRFARVWDLRHKDLGPICKWNFKHQAEVDVLAVNSSGLLATGSKTSINTNIKVYRYNLDAEDPSTLHAFSFQSPRSQLSPSKHIYPTCIRWGNKIHGQERFLLGGFSAKNEDSGVGEVCLWDIGAAQPTAIVRGSRTIFDIAWSPWTYGRYAVGCSASNNVNRGTHSVIRLYDSQYNGPHPNSDMLVNKQMTMELECPARDMNDIVFNPANEWLLSAGCTDGSIYMWDLRRPDILLHQFRHGPPAMEVEADASLELADTGVRFLSWSGSSRSLYTGSSDGVVATWDPSRSTEDAFLRTVAQLNSGVMSGAFNHDYSSLLLGEVNGSVTVLSVGNDDMAIRDCGNFKLQPADKTAFDEVFGNLNIPKTTSSSDSASGQVAARELVESGKIEIKPFGDLPFRQAVKGPKYDGPFDMTEVSVELRRKNEQFQERMKRAEVSNLEYKKVSMAMTYEEQGDAGHWQKRIPHELRAKSGKTSWPYQIDISCFRCKATLQKPDSRRDLVYCPHCDLTWRVGLLGYTLVNSSGDPCLPGDGGVASVDVSVSEEDSEDLHELMAFFQAMEDERAELQNVEDHYHDLWHVESPR